MRVVHRLVITTTDDCDAWRFSADGVAGLVQRQWPRATILNSKPRNTTITKQWIITVSDSTHPLGGHVGVEGKGIVLSGLLVDCAAVAVWARSTTPADVSLLLWDATGPTPLPLTGSTTADEIVNFFRPTARELPDVQAPPPKSPQANDAAG